MRGAGLVCTFFLLDLLVYIFTGTGKTIMMLALILSTLDDLPIPPDFDGDDVLTPIALRHFPQSPFAESRSAAIPGKSDPTPTKIPSLVEIVCHHVRASPGKFGTLRNNERLATTNLWDPIRKNVPFYLHFDNDFLRHVSARHTKPVLPQIIYLSPATLVVVPSTLQAQWNSEILKHCSSDIRTLSVRTEADIPSPQKLATDYDVSA